MTADTTPPAPGELTASPGDARPVDPAAKPPPADTTPSADGGGPPARPARPTSMAPEQLGFRPRRPVPWLSPVLLAGTAVRVVLAELFGAYLDKRELQNSLPAKVFDERPSGGDTAGGTGDADDARDGGELWLDYVADLGDGFHPTYTVAYLLAQPELTVEGAPAPLPRGRVLVMGGDQVYPTPSGPQYEDRFKGPYQAALPQPPADGPQPSMYALPGNHDWYDGLTAFLRLFARRAGGHIGGWRTRQVRSYFAIQLPQRWWLFGIDAQAGAYLDDPQLSYFATVAQQLRPGDRVILCTPRPGWVEASVDRQAYDTIDYFVRTVVEPTGASVRMMLSGDLHHYARYSDGERELIHYGGGGAYLYGTSRLPERLSVPPTTTLMRKASSTREYPLAATYPTKARSRRYAAGVFYRLPWRNPGFVGFLGVLHTLLLLALLGTDLGTATVDRHLVSIPVLVLGALVFLLTISFAMPPTAGRRRPKHWALGIGHGVVQLALAAAGTALWARLPLVELGFPLEPLADALLYLPASGLIASQVVAGYLLLASAFGANVNELFAGQGIVDAKGFLRLHIDSTGRLTGYPIAVDRVGRRWIAAPDALADRPWLEPTEPIAVRLAEPPFVVGPDRDQHRVDHHRVDHHRVDQGRVAAQTRQKGGHTS